MFSSRTNVSSCRRFVCSLAIVTIALSWFSGVIRVRADILDVREKISRESEQYRAAHFPDGRMPPKHDWRDQKPGGPGSSSSPQVPGGVGYGYYFYNQSLLWTNSTIADYYIVAPRFLNQEVSYLYLTSTCRAQLGTESLVAYSSINEVSLWIYDWSTASFQVMMDLPIANPQYLTQRPDEFGIVRQMVHVRNGTFLLGYANGLFQWQNRVQLFNFNRNDWDLIYTNSYATTNLADNLYASSGNASGYWGPIVETFGAYTNINPVGFDLIRLFQDGNPNPFWLNSSNSYVIMTAPWQLLTQASNTSYTVAVSSSNLSYQAYNAGTLCVTANTNAALFIINSSAGIVSSPWVVTPWGNAWDQTVADLASGNFMINFNPVPTAGTPAQQVFTILSNDITTVPAIYVFSPPYLNTVTADGSSVAFSWSSTTGSVYQVQYATNITQPNWVNLGGTLTASNAISYVTDPFGSDPQRFYRVQQQ